MSQIVKKSQFVVQPDGSLVVSGHIEPVNDFNQLEKIQDLTEVYATSDATVATVAAKTDDATKYNVKWVGPGNVTITASGDADLGDGVKTVNGTLDLTLVDDENEATKLNVVLDLAS